MGVARGIIAMLLGGALILIAVIGVAVWQGIELLTSRANAPVRHDDSTADRRAAIEAASTLATDLTTIDWQTIDADIQRILGDSTGRFHDDFATRAGEFTDVVRQARSVSTGTVTGAGVQTIGNGHASVLVAVSVTTTNEGAPPAEPRAWRTKITLESRDGKYVTSNVEFVP